MRALSQAFALAVPHEEALRIRDDVGFFQAVQAVASEGVIGIFAAAGLEKPDISVLSDGWAVG